MEKEVNEITYLLVLIMSGHPLVIGPNFYTEQDCKMAGEILVKESTFKATYKCLPIERIRR
jgi:hypothetical protein